MKWCNVDMFRSFAGLFLNAIVGFSGVIVAEDSIKFGDKIILCSFATR